MWSRAQEFCAGALGLFKGFLLLPVLCGGIDWNFATVERLKVVVVAVASFLVGPHGLDQRQVGA